MRVAILSAGPRLGETFDPAERFDARIGVNAGALAYPVDWWSCGDAQTFARCELPEDWPAPVLFTMTDSDAHFRNRQATIDRLKRHRMVLWSEVRRRVCPPTEGTNWSICAALVLAVDLGAQVIEIFGHYYPGEDPDNITDLSGYELAKRKENRARVLADFAVVKRWAEGRGIQVLERVPREEGARCG